MKKYAIVWTTTRGYMPGTNAILNALEFYNFQNVDVYVMADKDNMPDEEYRKQWSGINFIDLGEAVKAHPNKDWYWYLVFGDLQFALDELFDKYEVVLFWGADICIVNNFESYFELAEKTGQIILGTNEHAGDGLTLLDKLPKERPYKHTWDVPFADIPFFIPKNKRHLLSLMFEHQKDEGNEVDRMDGLNYAVRDLKEDIIKAHSPFWICNIPNWTKVERRGDFLYFAGNQMYSFHRKYWIKSYCENYMPGENEIKEHNIKMFNFMWRFFNNDCRVKWTEGIDVYE